jgi:glycosyltransferase involved in cell wall biosynthesis
MRRSRKTSDLIVLMPYLDDIYSLEVLIDSLQKNLSDFHLVVVDDGSTSFPLNQYLLSSMLPCSTLVSLKRNSGPQRAIALGLLFIENNFDYKHVLIMDSDGEDSPDSVPRLLDASHGLGAEFDILVASRLSRENSILFKLMWRFYRILFRLFTGKTMDFGNFSLLSRRAIQHLIHYPQIWIHLGASYLLSRLQIRSVSVPRGKRYQGTSRMNFTSLINHGLRSFVALSEVVIPRFFILSLVSTGLISLLLIYGYLFALHWFINLGLILLLFVIFATIQTCLILFLAISRSPADYHGGDYLNLIHKN